MKDVKKKKVVPTRYSRQHDAKRRKEIRAAAFGAFIRYRVGVTKKIINGREGSKGMGR